MSLTERTENKYYLILLHSICNQVTFTNWYAVALVMIIIVDMIAAGYFLVRSYFGNYTYGPRFKT